MINLLGSMAMRPFMDHVAGDQGGRAVEAAARSLLERFTDVSRKLPAALGRAHDRAWRTLEVALAGGSIWAWLAPKDQRELRRQVQAFLDSVQVGDLSQFPPDFRTRCVEQIRAARKAGILQSDAIDAEDLAQRSADWLRYSDPESLLAAEWEALATVADRFRRHGFEQLGEFVPLRPSSGESLLVTAVRYFFRREYERDPQLFRGLSVARLDLIAERQQAGFRELEEAFDQFGPTLAELLDHVGGVNRKLEDLIVKVDDLQGQLRLQPQVRPRDTMMQLDRRERELIRDVLDRYRALPADQQCDPELMNKLGVLLFGAGEPREASPFFRAASDAAGDDDPMRAAASHNAYRAALERRSYDEALPCLLEAARLDPLRFEPFPLRKYEPRSIIGAGTFGVAVRCTDKHTAEDVVIKTLHAEFLGRDLTEIFREARALSRLRHPGVIHLQSCDFADVAETRPYLVLDHFDGTTLEDHVREHGPLAVQDTVPLFRQIAQGLRAAHEARILHRDVKPGNVLVRRDGGGRFTVKLIDFGLALDRKLIGETMGNPDARTRSVVGVGIAGTLDYAAPEQLGKSDAPVGRASDVYGFARSWCYALFGVPQPGPKQWLALAETHPELVELLNDCLDEDPSQRPAGFAEVLDRLPGGSPTTAPSAVPDSPPPAGPPTGSWLNTLGQSVSSLIEGTRSLFVSADSPIRPTGETGATALAVGMKHEDSVNSVCFDPTGRVLASGSEDGTVKLWDVPAGTRLHEWTLSAEVYSVAYSPDGRLLAAGGEGREVELFNVATRERVDHYRHQSVWSLAFSPDGRLLATAGENNHAIRLRDVAGRVKAGRLEGHEDTVRGVTFSPDGRFLASGSADKTVRIWDVARQKSVATIDGHTGSVYAVAFSPDGRLLASAGGMGDQHARLWSVPGGRPIAAFRHYGSVVSLAFLAGGKILATGSKDGRLRLWSVPDGRSLLAKSLGGYTLWSVAYSQPAGMLAVGSADYTAKFWLLHESAGSVDWRARGRIGPVKPRLKIEVPEVVYAGDFAGVRVEVENSGTGDMLQLWARAEGEGPIGLPPLVFGRVRAGKTVQAQSTALIPADAAGGTWVGRLVFRESGTAAPTPRPLQFRVEPLPRPDFTMTAKPSGPVRPGEWAEVVAEVHNRTGRKLENLTLRLRPAPDGLRMAETETDLGDVANNARAEGRVGFCLEADASGPLELELRAVDDDGRTFAVERITFGQ